MKVKKFLSLFLSLVMLFSITASVDLSAYAKSQIVKYIEIIEAPKQTVLYCNGIENGKHFTDYMPNIYGLKVRITTDKKQEIVDVFNDCDFERFNFKGSSLIYNYKGIRLNFRWLNEDNNEKGYKFEGEHKYYIESYKNGISYESINDIITSNTITITVKKRKVISSIKNVKISNKSKDTYNISKGESAPEWVYIAPASIEYTLQYTDGTNETIKGELLDACNAGVLYRVYITKYGLIFCEKLDSINNGVILRMFDSKVNASYADLSQHQLQKKVTAATINKQGKIVSTCSLCNEIISNATISKILTPKLSTTSYTYNGKVKAPSVTVKDSKGKTLKKNTDYTVTYSSGRKAVGKYNVTIKFKGNYSGTVTKTFTIKPKSTSISKLTAGKKKFTVKWNKQSSQTTGYQLQYSTSSNFKSAKTVTISKNKTTSKTISNLKANKKYYVRVRTYKTVNGTKIYSSWSKAKVVTTKK